MRGGLFGKILQRDRQMRQRAVSVSRAGLSGGYLHEHHRRTLLFPTRMSTWRRMRSGQEAVPMREGFRWITLRNEEFSLRRYEKYLPEQWHVRTDGESLRLHE